MNQLLDKLPKKEDLVESMPKTDLYDVGSFNGMDTEVKDITDEITQNTPPPGQDINIDATIPADLSSESVTNRLAEPLTSMEEITAENISESVKKNSHLVTPDKPSFDINTPMKTISEALAPSGQPSSPDISDPENFPGFDSNEALLQLKKLADAGKATPMRMIKMYLQVFSEFIDKATDKEKIVQLAVESLEEIYLGQIIKLQYNIPYKVVQDIEQLTKSNFLDRYETVLDNIEKSTKVDIDLLELAREEIIPTLVDVKRAKNTLTAFADASIDDLQKAIDNVLEFTGDGDVVLQTFFDDFESKVLTVIGKIKEPVTAIKDMAVQISTFLTNAAQKAEEAADKVSDTIADKLQTADKFISGDLTNKITEVNKKINDFLDEIGNKADSALGTAKGGLSSVTNGVEDFFDKVNDLKEKLETAVDELAQKTDDTTTKAFEEAQTKIEGLLDKITDVLNTPTVKDALQKTKDGIDKFKKVMEEVSFQPVFDVVVTKTGELEVKVKAIKVDELGVPQKTAMKLGAKVIQAVKVDEIIKPELVAIFKDLRDPIAALIEELKKGVLQINQLIEDFAPGTIVREYIENNEIYKTFIGLLDQFKPSVLLQPLKDANKKLTSLVEQLDPNILINKLQELFNELFQLTKVISPDKLNGMIWGAVNTVNGELKNIRDVKMDEIINTIKETISLEKLLEGTGIEDVANAEIWDILKFYLGGEFLNKITDALDYVQLKIEDEVKKLGFNHHEEEVKKLKELIDKQINWTVAVMKPQLTGIKDALATIKTRLQDLDNRRRQILINKSDIPEYKDMLTKLSLENMIALEDVFNKLLNADLAASLAAFKKPLEDNRYELGKVQKDALEKAAPNIFQHQFSDPIKKIVTKIQTELASFTEAIEAIKNILDTINKLGEQIDTKLADVLKKTAEDTKQIITSVIDAVNSAASTVTESVTKSYDLLIETLNKFSPNGFLNSFAETDFESGGLEYFKNLLQSPTSDAIAIFLSKQITSQQSQLLAQNDANWKKIVLEAFNSALFDSNLNELQSQAQSAVAKEIENQKNQPTPNKKFLLRLEAAASQLGKVKGPLTTKGDKIRLNRMILEAAYTMYIEMSLQSLHPFIVEQVADLYPETVVQTLDTTYVKIVDKIKGLPSQLIQQPLDNKYNELKTMFLDHFDIEGIFRVLEVKLDGMDEDLELGLDRVAYAFNKLIDSLDSRLSE